MLDLQFGLPTQVRDTALGQRSAAPTSAINREYYAQNSTFLLASIPTSEAYLHSLSAQWRVNLRMELRGKSRMEKPTVQAKSYSSDSLDQILTTSEIDPISVLSSPRELVTGETNVLTDMNSRRRMR